MDSRAFLGLQRSHNPYRFAEDGTLLATASQSCVVRFWPPDQLPGQALDQAAYPVADNVADQDGGRTP